MIEPTDGEAADPGYGWDPDGLDWRFAARAEIQAAKMQLQAERQARLDASTRGIWTKIKERIRGGRSWQS